VDSKSIGEMALRFFVISALASFFAYRRTRKEEVAIAISIEDEFHPDIDWTTFDGDPRIQQGYYISQGHDIDSSFYEVRQYEEDNYSVGPVKAQWTLPWLPGIDREFGRVLTSDFSREQYSRYWQTIFVLDCKHYLPSIHEIESAPEETYCFICRGHSDVVKIVSRRSIFPAEGDSIKTREDWMRAVEAAQNDGRF
jgi:hypothetical protein